MNNADGVAPGNMVPAIGELKSETKTWMTADGRLVTYAPLQKRACDRCRRHYDWDGSEHKTICMDCYTKHVRRCAVCPATIHPSAPKFKTMCTLCYITSRRDMGYTVCPTCPPEKSTHLIVPPGKTACSSCQQRLQIVRCNRSEPVLE